MKAIQSVAYALTGVNIFANASANSMKNMAGSAKKAKEETKQLAGVHNEINNVQTNKNNDSGSGGGATPSFDLSQMDNTPNKLIDAIKNGNWYEVGATIGQKLNEAMDSIPWDKIQNTAKKVGNNIGEFINGFVETTDWYEVGKTISQGINTAVDFATSVIEKIHWENLGNAIGKTIGAAIANIDWTNIGRLIVKGFGSIKEFLVGIGNGIVDGIFEGIAEKTGKGFIWKIIKALVVDPIIKHIKELLGIHSPSTVMRDEVGVNIVEGIFQGILQAISGVGQWIYEHIFKPFIDGFKNVFGIHSPSTVMEEQGHFIMEGLFNGIQSLVGKVVEIWNNIKQTAINIFNGIKDSIVNIWNNVTNTTVNVWNTIKNKVREGAQGAWNGITSIFGNVSGWFRDKFSQAWQAVKNVFSTGGAIFDGIKDGILNGLKAIVNAIINGINKVIAVPFNGLNSALRKIRSISILGISPFRWISTVGVPQIPRLAKGNVAYEPLIAQFGEYAGASSNPEITTPQNIMRETFEDVMSDFISNNDNKDRPLNITIQVGNKKLGQMLLDDLKDMKRRTGKDFEVLVGG